MALDFPSSPGVGQQFTSGGVTWIWDGTKWTAQGSGPGLYLPLTGGTMTGDLILNRDAQVALGAATKEQVDARGAGDNRLINGDMRIDQRGGGSTGVNSTSAYVVDRWQYQTTLTGKITLTQGSGGPSSFRTCITCLSGSAYAPLAGDVFQFIQIIEADAITDFAWGTPNAQPVTLSFWAYCSLTGTFSGVICNYGTVNRSYPFTFAIPVAATWTKIAVNIPGDTAGTWMMSGNGGALTVRFDLGSGSTFRAPANVWAAGNFIGANGAVSMVATNGANFSITGVKLEIGSVATPFNRQSLAKSMADCQRYYQYQPYLLYTAYSSAASTWYTTVPLQVLMRAAPTVVYSNQVYTNASALATNNVNNTALAFNFSLNAAGIGNVTFSSSFSAEL